MNDTRTPNPRVEPSDGLAHLRAELASLREAVKVAEKNLREGERLAAKQRLKAVSEEGEECEREFKQLDSDYRQAEAKSRALHAEYLLILDDVGKLDSSFKASDFSAAHEDEYHDQRNALLAKMKPITDARSIAEQNLGGIRMRRLECNRRLQVLRDSARNLAVLASGGKIGAV
jgi:uncharacterized protein (DUF3084 family)